MKSRGEGIFTLHRDVDVPFTFAGVSSKPHHGRMPATFSVRWPNGLPCALVEAFLVQQYREGASARPVDGGSLRATVSKLSHLVRFCWDRQRDFWDLDDADFYEFIVSLQDEKRPGAPLVPQRDNNTVRSVSGACISFLLWLQNDLRFRDDLVGIGPRYRIRLKRAGRAANGHPAEGAGVYHCLPPQDTHEPKRPMPTAYRDRLWEAVSTMAQAHRIHPAWAISEEDQEVLAGFLKNRRELLLYLLEATGARPSELAGLSVLANCGCYASKKLLIPTSKRRRPISRSIDVQPDVAMRLELFILGDRASLLSCVRRRWGGDFGNDRVFVSMNGSPMHERSLSADFSRLAICAGLGNFRSCMSMFRHRFITKQVALHLEAYMSESGKVRPMMTDADYSAVLKRVSVITGHGDERSLLHYLDLAWEELGAFRRFEAARDMESAVDSTVTRLIAIIGDAKLDGGRNRDATAHALEALRALQSNLRGAIARAKNRPR